jgi:hypothetical protein
MKLNYWAAHNYSDVRYNQRAKTKKELLAKMGGWDLEDFSPPHKVSIEYRDGFDLLNSCLTDSPWWEEPKK